MYVVTVEYKKGEIEMEKSPFKRYQTTPEWIKNLPPGRYTIKQLKELTNFADTSISVTIQKYGATREILRMYHNLVEFVYIWPGIEEFYNKFGVPVKKQRYKTSRPRKKPNTEIAM